MADDTKTTKITQKFADLLKVIIDHRTPEEGQKWEVKFYCTEEWMGSIEDALAECKDLEKANG